MVDGMSGFIIDKFDVENFAARVQQLISDENLRIEMGQNGKNFVDRTFSHVRLVSDMRNLYKSLLEGRG